MTPDDQERFAPALGWACPVCGATKYEPIYKNNGIRGPGYRAWVVGYVCDGCTVQFGDPDKFRKGTPNDQALP